MSEAIIVALITGGSALIGVVISNLATSRNLTSKIEILQAITDTKVDALTFEVREHNNFAKRLPVVEEQIKVLGREVKELKGRKEK